MIRTPSTHNRPVRKVSSNEPRTLMAVGGHGTPSTAKKPRVKRKVITAVQAANKGNRV